MPPAAADAALRSRHKSFFYFLQEHWFEIKFSASAFFLELQIHWIFLGLFKDNLGTAEGGEIGGVFSITERKDP